MGSCRLSRGELHRGSLESSLPLTWTQRCGKESARNSQPPVCRWFPGDDRGRRPNTFVYLSHRRFAVDISGPGKRVGTKMQIFFFFFIWCQHFWQKLSGRCRGAGLEATVFYFCMVVINRHGCSEVSRPGSTFRRARYLWQGSHCMSNPLELTQCTIYLLCYHYIYYKTPSLTFLPWPGFVKML